MEDATDWADTDSQFLTEVFPAELSEINRRRRENQQTEVTHSGAPSASAGLVGLAISGGGIRSATLGLGVVQALSKLGVFGAVDYLSTVSGGGFVGSAVSSLLTDPRARADGAGFPLAERPGVGDTAAMRHLRNSQHYVAPGGWIDYVRMPAIIVRGIVLNLLLVIPYLMLLVVAMNVIYLVLGGPSDFFVAIPLVTVSLFLVSLVTFPVVWRIFGPRFSWAGRNRYDNIIGLLFFGVLLSALLIPFFSLVDRAVWMTPSLETVKQLIFPAATARLVIASLAAIVLLTVVSLGVPAAAKWRTTIGLWLAAIIGPSIMLGLFLVFCMILIDPPGTNGTVARELRAATPAEVTELNHGVLPAILVGQTVPALEGSTTLVTLSSTDTVEATRENRHWKITTASGHVFMVSAWPDLRVWQAYDHWPHTDDLTFILVAFAWLIANAVFGNVNMSGLHGFWRDRLSRAYLIRRPQNSADEAMVPTDGLKLSELAPQGTQAPLHLVNVSLNLNGTTELNVRGRNCDFFYFSKLFCGGRRTGYARTPELEALHPHLNLGTAMAISGAAAAPNMGVSTDSRLTFAMTMLDVRLGYWLPSPAFVRGASWVRRLQLRIGTGPSYLVREALGRVNSSGPFVNLSDGGHIENLAIIQLLRRRCKLIIVADGEQDQSMRFDGLLRLMLYAQVDLGIQINIDLEDLRRTHAGTSASHYAVGSIVYGTNPDGTPDVGWLLYLKASVTGDEGEVMRDYRLGSPTFPQESTANQFFNERQWEMYRALGAHIATGALSGADPRMADVENFLKTRVAL